MAIGFPVRYLFAHLAARRRRVHLDRRRDASVEFLRRRRPSDLAAIGRDIKSVHVWALNGAVR